MRNEFVEVKQEIRELKSLLMEHFPATTERQKVDSADEQGSASPAAKITLKKKHRTTVRMTSSQTEVLEAELQANPVWNTSKIRQLSKRLRVSMKKVYKWRWDKNKRAARAA